MTQRWVSGFGLAIVALWCCGCEPASMSLDGEWRLCRSTSDAMPGGDADWQATRVPFLLDQSNDKPFLWYRRSFTVPAEASGRHVFLRFGGVRFVSEVYLNGTKVGGHYGGWEPFEIEITTACCIGKPNDLLVRVQDVTGVIEQPMDYAKQGRGVRFLSQAKDSVMAPVGSQYTRVGIWQPVELAIRQDVYVKDVFIRTSVRKSEIEADVTVQNLSNTDRSVRVASKVKEANLPVGESEVKVPAGGAASVTLRQSWKNPRLWGPEDPCLYHLVTQVCEGKEALDAHDARFGFREFWTDGIYLVLNGTRMKFLATAGHPRGNLDKELSKDGAKDFYSRIREAGCVAMRLHANVWPEWWYEAADEVGMPIIMESALFCNPAEYALSKPEFWENYHKHLEAIVKHKRNHPAIVMYSLENEILHCGGDRVKDTEHRLAEAGRLVKGIDGTRPILYDADGDPEGVADVVNLHYPLNFDKCNLWPDAGYWLETGMEVAGWPKTFWKWDRKKPLYFGEFLHLQHYQEADPYTVLLGDEAYLDHDSAMAKTKAMAWGMQIEAYRAAELSGMCPWTLTETGPFPSNQNPRYLAVKRAYQKNAAFIREYDTRFYENEKVDRTVYLYNDTLGPAALALEWRLSKGDTPVDCGKRQFQAKPAQKFELKIPLTMPRVTARTPLTLTLRVFSGQRLAFEDAKRYWVFPREKPAAPAARRIALFEGPGKTIGKALREARVTPILVNDLSSVPKADILVIESGALSGVKTQTEAFVVGDESAPGEALRAFVREGGTVIVLEQDAYPPGLLPADLCDRGCTIAFLRTQDSLLFKGLIGDDVKFWRDGHVVCRKTISKPRSGRYLAHVDSGGPGGLVYLPLCEIRDGKGRYLLSQFVIGDKLGKEPVAQVLLENMLAYAAVPAPATAPLAIVQDKLPIAEALNGADAVFTDLSGKLDKADLKAVSTLLAEADCPEVERSQAKLLAFVEGGGNVILHGGTRDGLSRIQKLFPEPILAQKSNAIPVTIADWDPAINGLCNQDLYWYGSRKGLDWHVRTPLSPDVCRYVISAGLPDPKDRITVEAESMALVDGHPTFGKEDVYMGAHASIKAQVWFPRTGEYAVAVCGKGTPLVGVYPQIRISVDGKTRGSITTDGTEWGTYSISTRVEEGSHEVELEFVNDAWDPATREDRNVWLDKLIVGVMPALQSKRLLSPAGLVKVPVGKGAFLLDEVRWSEAGASSEKASRYICSLLTNLRCDFRGRAGATVIPGDKMAPEGDFRFSKGEAGVAGLGSNGTVSVAVQFGKARKYEFAVRASGTEAAGEFPNIALSLDGQKIGDLRLTRPGWQILRIEADVPEGRHKVGLAFTNDYYNPPEDRNLKIAHLEIR